MDLIKAFTNEQLKEQIPVLNIGDTVKARIISVDINEKNPQDSKIGLVTRGQVGLAKIEWIEEDEKKRSVA